MQIGEEMLSKLTEFLMSLAVFSGKKIYNDYLGEEIESFSVEPIGTANKIRSYTDGGKVMEYKFKILQRSEYPDNFENTEKFFEQAADELKVCSRNNIFPDIADDITVIDISAVSGVIKADNDFRSAGYYMIFKMIYYVN